MNENEKIIKDGKEIANKFKYFANIIKKLSPKKDTGTSFESEESCRMIKISKIWKKNWNLEKKTEAAVANAIKDLLTGKASVSNDIPVSIMKETIDAYCPKLTQSWMTV